MGQPAASAQPYAFVRTAVRHGAQVDLYGSCVYISCIYLYLARLRRDGGVSAVAGTGRGRSGLDRDPEGGSPRSTSSRDADGEDGAGRWASGGAERCTSERPWAWAVELGRGGKGWWGAWPERVGDAKAARAGRCQET